MRPDATMPEGLNLHFNGQTSVTIVQGNQINNYGYQSQQREVTDAVYEEMTDVAPHTPPTETQKATSEGDERIRRAIIRLMALRRADGRYQFSSQSQWICIYRILVDDYGFPPAFTEFQDRIMRMGTADFRIACTYDALKDISGVYCKPFKQWDVSHYGSDRSSYFNTKYEICCQFIKILKSMK